MRTRPTAAFTLVELMIAVTLAGGVVAGSVYVSTLSTSRALKTETAVSTLDSKAWKALEFIGDRLESAGTQGLIPPSVTAPFASTSIEYRRLEGFAAGEPVWGNAERIELRPSPADPDDGIDNDGNGLVDEGRVVWIENVGLPDERTVVVTRWVRETAEGEVPGNGVDDNGNGLDDEAGLSFVYGEGTVVVRLTLERLGPQRTLLTRTLERTTALRNTEE